MSTENKLEKARAYEKKHEGQVPREERPLFHITPRIGWLNDPNGFSYYKGQYHMFYQYHPYDSNWGPMHWGHVVSPDLLHWEFLPVVMAPDTEYDCDGCFSGSAAELDDGRQLLMYTGVIREEQEDGTFCEVQTQCLAVGDGLNYEKYENNPVLTERDVPEGGSRFDFRDPRVWRKEDGSYLCIVGNRPADGSGQLLLYASEDGFHWTFKKVFAENKDRFGKMWECPDFFVLDGKGVILTSPQDMLPQGFEYHNGNGTLCLIGSYDEETDTFVEERDQSIDYGIDFYAPQTILTPDGRRVMIGWMQNWDTCSLRMPHQLCYGQMTMPRELSVKNGRLYQAPLREIEDMRCDKVSYSGVEVSDVVTLDGISGRVIDMELSIRPADAEKMYRKFAIRFAQNDKYYTSLSFRPYEKVLKIDRKFSGSRRAIIHQRRSQVNSEDGALKLRMILDRYSVEVFINDGEQVVTATMYTEQSAEGISFWADGTVIMDITKYNIKFSDI